MKTLRDIIAAKGPKVWSIDREATVLQTVYMLTEHRVGAALITDCERPVGIFTERDLMRRVVREGRDPAQTCVGDVMTELLIWGTPETTIEEAQTLMRDRRIRHLPMSDGDGKLLGMISIGDLNAHLLDAQKRTIYEMEEYIYGRV
jgi:CBS domain-containing protein